MIETKYTITLSIRGEDIYEHRVSEIVERTIQDTKSYVYWLDDAVVVSLPYTDTFFSKIVKDEKKLIDALTAAGYTVTE
jgi:hypothetical protein